MRNLIILTFLLLSHQGFSQILPSSHGVHHKKSSSGAGSDTWDSSTKASCITLSNGNRTLLESNCGGAGTWNSVYGSIGVSSGIKEWEVTIDAWDDFGTNNFDVMVGIARSRNNLYVHFQNGSVGYGYILQNGGKYYNSFSNYGASYGVGDVIKISFNGDTNQLTFYKNGVSQGLAYTVSEGTYYLAVSVVKSTNTRITITN